MAMKQTRQRVVKFVATVEITREDWGYRVDQPQMGLIATDKTEAGALEKMDQLIVQQVEFGTAHGMLKSAVKVAVRGK
jgi:hypothetical protein